jgi:hypothetical protein
MDDLKIIRNVVARHLQAGPVVPFAPKKPRVPQVTIAGKKYNLSTFGGFVLGDREDDDLEESYQGARLIRPPPGANKWRYLWVFDTEKSIVAMWRVSDGNEKDWGPSSSQMSTVVSLERKGQINRVSNAEFRKIEAEMRKREHETIEALQKSVEDNKSQLTKEVDKLVEDYFESHVAPKLDRAISSVERGATPLGFDYNERIPSTKKHQMISFAFYQTMKSEMPMNAVLKYLTSKGVDVDEAGQWVDWAIQDVNEKAYAAYVPREGLDREAKSFGDPKVLLAKFQITLDKYLLPENDLREAKELFNRVTERDRSDPEQVKSGGVAYQASRNVERGAPEVKDAGAPLFWAILQNYTLQPAVLERRRRLFRLSTLSILKTTRLTSTQQSSTWLLQEKRSKKVRSTLRFLQRTLQRQSPRYRWVTSLWSIQGDSRGRLWMR